MYMSRDRKQKSPERYKITGYMQNIARARIKPLLILAFSVLKNNL